MDSKGHKEAGDGDRSAVVTVIAEPLLGDVKEKKEFVHQHQQQGHQQQQQGHNHKRQAILEFLKREAARAVGTLEIAKHVNCKTKSQVNADLYALQTAGLIRKETQQPPTWKLV